MITVLEILKKARELLSDPARWTKRSWARDIYGRPRSYDEPDAACFCSVGAVKHQVDAEARPWL